MADEPVLTIAGIPEDRLFAHMCYVATHLSQILPSFQFKKICKQGGEWEPWLNRICKTHNWSHTSSPLVWRQVGVSTGNATYMGGPTQFWEFIHEYYGIESRLTTEELRVLKQDFLQEFKVEARIAASQRSERKPHIGILGGNTSLCENLVIELFLVEKLNLGNRRGVKLYNPLYNTKSTEQIEELYKNSKGLHSATIVRTISAALVDCDILIILDEVLRRCRETTDQWLKRNRTDTLELAAQINNFAPEFMKVIYCSTGPTCFNASILAPAVAKKLDANNIVVVSAHEGLQTLYEMFKSDNVPLDKIGCPPVWGFLGINHFVDVCNAVQTHEIYRPNKRALKPHEGTTLPLGTMHTELRSIMYMAHDKRVVVSTEKHKVDDVQKCTAICDLLRLWYDESCDSDSMIISLGIYSDGTFEIPSGIFFSQPVYLKERKGAVGVWVPCTEFPVPNHPNWILNNLIDTARILLEELIPFVKSGVTLGKHVSRACEEPSAERERINHS